MNRLNSLPSQSPQDRFGLKLAAHLSSAAEELPHDISERLRIARMQALSQRKVLKAKTASVVVALGAVAAISYGDEKSSLWRRIAAFAPMIALVAGIITINLIQNDNRADDLAEVDAALLTDDLPPAAFTDPGFAQFLRINKAQTP
jgi:hypothetical protein